MNQTAELVANGISNPFHTKSFFLGICSSNVELISLKSAQHLMNQFKEIG